MGMAPQRKDRVSGDMRCSQQPIIRLAMEKSDMRYAKQTYALPSPTGPTKQRGVRRPRRSQQERSQPRTSAGVDHGSGHDAPNGTCYVEKSTAVLFVIMGGLTSADCAHDRSAETRSC